MDRKGGSAKQEGRMGEQLKVRLPIISSNHSNETDEECLLHFD